ncbi:MAG: NAD(P)-dependent oxidoreductase [SAR202 cluster bacterium]|nr:NAD(P)-dependent oxidoreductase [SAR202 cluster bacterium]
MSKKRALILAPFTAAGLASLNGQVDVVYESWMETRRLQDPEALAQRLRDQHIEILLVESDFVFEEIFEGAPDLNFVGVCRGATHQVDIEAATAHGVLLVNTPGRNAQAVAEHALGLMLALARRIPDAHAMVVEGRWDDPVSPYINMRGIELDRKTLGIFGLGVIGQRLAALGSAMGMIPVAYDPHVVNPPYDVALLSLEDVLSTADFFVIHAPLTDETEGAIDQTRLATMKPTAYLVNLSDAAIVSESALVTALQSGRLAGAAMDVYVSHPVPPNSALLSLDNVVLTPHIGGATAETVERHSQMMSEDILRWIAGERPVHLVNTAVWHAGG